MIIKGRPSILDGPTMLNKYVRTTSTLGALSSTLSDQEIRDVMVQLWTSPNLTEAEMGPILLEIMRLSNLTLEDISRATTVPIQYILPSVELKPQVQQLTPEIAKEILYKGMTGGIDQYYVDLYGGIENIKKTASDAGMQQDTPSIVAYETENNLKPSLHTLINSGTPEQVVENVTKYNAMSQAEKNIYEGKENIPETLLPVNPVQQPVNTKSEFAIAFHNYIYSDTTDARVATDNGLLWYLKNKEIFGLTDQKFVDLWNESEGTMFTVYDLNIALNNANVKTTMPVDIFEPDPSFKKITEKNVDTDFYVDKPTPFPDVVIPITIKKSTDSIISNSAVVPLLAVAAALYFGIGA